MDSSQPGNEFSNEKLPITTFDLPGREIREVGGEGERKKFQKFAVQCLIVVISLNIFLYHAARLSPARATSIHSHSHKNATLAFPQPGNSQSNSPTSSNSNSSSHEYNQRPAWLLAAAGAQTERTSVSFDGITDICASFSQDTSSSNCATNTIASVLLLSDSLLSLRSELINFASPHFSKKQPLNLHSNPSALLDSTYPTPMNFPRAVPDYITHTIGSSIHHVGYYCPLTSTCNNPVFSISTHEDIPLLFTFLPSILGTHTQALKFGFGNATGYHFATNGFATGGFDVLLERSKTRILDPKEDYPQMKHEVHCLLSDGLELPGLFFNIRNRDPEGKGFHGAISPWTQSGKSEIERMKTIVAPEQNMITCPMATAMRSSMRMQLWVFWGSLLGLTGSGVIVSLYGWWLEHRHGRIRL